MFERFTDRARQVVVFAEEEARSLKRDQIDTEHILLGLMREKEGLAARVLETLRVTVDGVRAEVPRLAGSGEEVTSGRIPFAPRAKKVLEVALREALSLGHNYIGTEHILLGLVRENEGVAARILLDFNLDSSAIRKGVIDLMAGADIDPGRRHEAPRETRPSLDAIGLSELMLDGAGTALLDLIEKIRERAARPADAGDLLVLLASVPDGLAARSLAALGVDGAQLAAAAAQARQDGATSGLTPSPEAAAEIEKVREERNRVLVRARALAERERELLERAQADADARRADALRQLRARLGLSEEEGDV